MSDTPPDWVLIEAAKRSDRGPYHLKETYQNVPTFRALCDMIQKYEQPPVDYTDQALADQLRAFCPNDLRCYQGRDPVKIFRDGLARRGVELRRIEEANHD